MNKVFLLGNLTRDPELRYTQEGKAVSGFSLAINNKYKTKDGVEKDEVLFVPISVWGRQAETCAEYLKKGSKVAVEGRLKMDEWEKDGQKRSKMKVVANHVEFLGGGKGKAGGEGTAAPEADASQEQDEPEPSL